MGSSCSATAAVRSPHVATQGPGAAKPVPGFTVHGFRSSFKDFCGERSGAPREIAELCPRARDRQRRGADQDARSDLLDRRRQLMQQWATFLLAPPATGSKVVALRGRRRG